VDINPAGWVIDSYPLFTFSYKIFSGVPVSLYFLLNGAYHCLGGTGTHDHNGHAVSNKHVNLLDNGTWQEITLDLMDELGGGTITEFEFFTNGNGKVGDEFWIDEVRAYNGFGGSPNQLLDNVNQGIDKDAFIKISPNPFNPSTVISFSYDPNSSAGIAVFNVNGKIIKEWNFQSKKSSSFSKGHESEKVLWDGKAESGQSIAGGIYIIRLISGKKTKEIKAVFIK
jgi:hypothetical protein